MKEKLNNYLNNDHTFDKKTMLGIICIIIVISGIIGFLVEYIFYYFNGGMKIFYWRGGNFLPWINIYAIGAVGMYFTTYRYRKNPLKVVLISMLLCGVLEYIAGLGMYIIGDGFRCWDYNTEILSFGTIGGFVSVRSVLSFGIASLFFMYILVPAIFYIAQHTNKKLFLTISIVLCSIFLIDEIYNLAIARIFKLPRASDIYKKLGMHYVKFN